MHVLCLDTATADVAAAVVDLADPARTVVRAVRDARGAGEHLMPLTLEALAAARVAMPALGAVAVGLGPGPFTGLRAGVVTGAVLAHTLGIPAYGACSLDAYAAEYLEGCGAVAGEFVVATDARRREVYWARYDRSGRIDGPAVDLPAVLAARLDGAPALGPGAVRYADVLCSAVPGPAGSMSETSMPVARLASLVAARVRGRAPSEALVPLYLRRPDAVEPTPAVAGAR